MFSTSASVQIALAVKATLDGYDLPQKSKEPTILTVKNLTIEFFQMAAAVKSNKTGRKFGHMHLILNEKEYRIAMKNNTGHSQPTSKAAERTPRLPILDKGPTNKVQSPPDGG